MNTFFMAGMIAFLFSGGILNASNAELFNYNKDKVNEDLKELMILEDYLHQHPSITLTQLISHKNTAFPDEHLLSLAASIHFAAEPPLGIPSFLWGCMFGVSGVAIVYFIVEDKEETKKAFTGCIVSGVVAIAIYAVLISRGLLYY